MPTAHILTFYFALSISFAQNVFAHGDDAAGPHGGFIRMPGAFHTEVVPGDDEIQVFLLDMNWEHPSTTASSITVNLRQAKETKTLKCKAKDVHFVCTLPKKAALTNGQLTVHAVRENQRGNAAVYELPLKLNR